MRILIGARAAWARPWPKGWGRTRNDHRRIAQGAHGPDGGASARCAGSRRTCPTPRPPPRASPSRRRPNWTPFSATSACGKTRLSPTITTSWPIRRNRSRAVAGHQHHRHDPAVATADPAPAGSRQAAAGADRFDLRIGAAAGPKWRSALPRRRCRALSTLRERFRAQRLAVTCLQLGYLNTEDGLAVARDDASRRGEGTLAPVHDVVAMVRALLSLSDAACGNWCCRRSSTNASEAGRSEPPFSIARATRDSELAAAASGHRQTST